MDEHTLNDLLECSVCLERLDTSSKVLPCQHTFCRKCLEVIVSSRQGELRCPECRILVDIKIDELPPNVLLMRILEGMKNAAAAKTQQQSNHLNDSNKIDEAQKLNQEQQQQIKLKQQQQQQQHQQKQMLQYQQQQQFKQKQQAVLQQQHQQHAALAPQSPPSNSSSSSVPSAPSAQRRLLLPHAYALYDFNSSEPTDLHFKKGDLVLLRRKIDINWYVGQLNGVEGTFPINYVQVIVALPAPHAIALYDFKMGPNEEEGCLTFKKGTPIHVLRRVDHNWAEGRIGANIGIFPIAFVELNALAKQLLDSFLLQNPTATPPSAASAAAFAHQQPLQNPTHPPPTTTTTPPPQQQQQQPQPPPPRNLPPIPLIDPTTNLTPSDSTTPSSTSPNSTETTCSSSISSNSIPSSPNQSPNTPQHHVATTTAAVVVTTTTTTADTVRYRDCKEKRHSLNALLSAGGVGLGAGGGGAAPALSVLQSNRHSAEILSMPSELSTSTQQNVRQRSGAHVSVAAPPPNAITASPSAIAAPQSTVAREQQQTHTVQTPPARINVLKSSGPQNVPPTLPWGYLALYPYKPRKGDELELKKGCVYIVTERCLDGWFKGKNWQDTSGVFPGNYVTPLRQRDHQQLMHQWKFVPQQQSIPTPQQQQTNSNLSTTATAKNQNHFENINTRLVGTNASVAGVVVPGLSHQPPDLPPRQITAGSVWTKPLGHTVEAFFNRYSNKTPPTQTDVKDSKEKESSKSKDSGNSTITTTPSTTSSTSSSASAAVNLMKRLTHMKSRSKSPGGAVIASINSNCPAKQSAHASLNYSMDNPTFEDVHVAINNTTTHTQMHPMHVRSGSCPSQLLQSLPMDLTTLQINENILNQQQHQQQQQHKQQVSPQATYGSQRIKGNKERSQLQNVRQSMDGTFRSGIYNSSTTATQQQQQPATANILLTKCGQQQAEQIQTNLINHRKSQSLDANTLTTAPPPAMTTAAAPPPPPTNTTAPCNITAAAIATSATTKSTQNTRESRFRCVVPYPPNSDIELELHVGDLIYVHRKQKNGWYKGTHARTNKTGLFPASFVEPDI